MKLLPNAVLCAIALHGCAHSGTPADSATHPAAPLPSAIDLLVSHQVELELRPDQIERLRAIGKKLDQANAPIAAELARASNGRPASDEGPPPVPRSRGGAGMGGGMGGSRGRRAAMNARAHATPAPAPRRGPVSKEMEENQEAAVAEAFSLLDDQQQQRAARLLDDNDLDPPSVDSVQSRVDHAAGQAPAPR